MRLSISTKIIGLLSFIFLSIAVWAANSFPNLSTDQFHVTGATVTTVPYFDSNKKLVSSAVTPTELGYLSGVTSALQTQLGLKAPSAGPTFTGTVTGGTFSGGTWSGTAIGPTRGGTGLTSYTTGDIVAATSTNTLGVIPAGSVSGQVLMSNGSGVAPTYQTVVATPPVGVYAYNALVNGGLDIWQAGTSTTITDTGAGSPNIVYAYQADQWFASNRLGGGTIEGVLTYARTTGVTDGTIFGASIKVTTAPTGTGLSTGIVLGQMLSAAASRPFYNSTASFSVLVKALGNVTSVNLIPIYNTTEAITGHSVYGSTSTVTVNSSTFTLVSLNNVAMGTAQSTTGVVGFKISVNGVSSGNIYDLNNGFVIEQGMMNLGATVGTFARQHNDPAAELHAAEYFLEKDGGTGTTEGLGVATCLATGASTITHHKFRTIKRIVPTFGVTNVGNIQFSDSVNNYAASAASVRGNAGIAGASVIWTVATGPTVNISGYMTTTNANAYIYWDARML